VKALLKLFKRVEPVAVQEIKTRFPAVKEILTGAEAEVMNEIHEFAGYLEDIIQRHAKDSTARDNALHKLEEVALWAGKAVVK